LLADKDFYDNLPISFDGIRLNTPRIDLSKVVDTGTLILIQGSHGSGKQSVVNVVTDTLTPPEGNLLFAPHLSCLHVAQVPEVITHLSLFDNLTLGSIGADPSRVRRVVSRLGLTGKILDILDADIRAHQELKNIAVDTTQAENAELSVKERSAWHRLLSYNEKKRVHMARALIYNPEIMVLHKPVDDVDVALSKKVMEILREFIDLRGVELDANSFNRRHTRTCFCTCGDHPNAEHFKSYADSIWELDPANAKVQMILGGWKSSQGGEPESSVPTLGPLTGSSKPEELSQTLSKESRSPSPSGRWSQVGEFPRTLHPSSVSSQTKESGRKPESSPQESSIACSDYSGNGPLGSALPAYSGNGPLESALPASPTPSSCPVLGVSHNCTLCEWHRKRTQSTQAIAYTQV